MNVSPLCNIFCYNSIIQKNAAPPPPPTLPLLHHLRRRQWTNSRIISLVFQYTITKPAISSLQHQQRYILWCSTTDTAECEHQYITYVFYWLTTYFRENAFYMCAFVNSNIHIRYTDWPMCAHRSCVWASKVCSYHSVFKQPATAAYNFVFAWLNVNFKCFCRFHFVLHTPFVYAVHHTQAITQPLPINSYQNKVLSLLTECSTD
jgi:hypothetical protein